LSRILKDLSMTPTDRTPSSASLRSDLTLVALLVGVGVVARLMPHEWNFTPIAASALFAGTVLNRRLLAFAVPVAALLLSDIFIGFDSTAMTFIVYGLFLLPACVALLPGRAHAPFMFVPVIVAYSLVFFLVTNFAVWALDAMYPHTLAGLATCYAAGLPFLPQTVIGDLFWAAVLFGGYALVQRAPRLARRSA
jgi:hypothetical protein